MSSLATIRSMIAYAGPLRDEPIAIELHNTVYAANGVAVDGLADSAGAAAWVDALGPRLPEGGSGRRGAPSRDELVALRTVVRDALADAVAGTPTPRATLEAINADSARAPRSPVALWQPAGAPPGGHRRPRRNACRRRACRAGGRRDRFADRAAPCRPAGVRRPRLRPDVPQGPPAPRVVLERLRQPRPPGTPLPARPSQQPVDADVARARGVARATGRRTRFGGRLVVVGGEAGAGKTALVEASPSRWAAACCSAPASTSRPRPRRDGGGGRASEGWRVGEHPPQAARALASGR